MKMQKNETIVLCSVARAFVQISENGPRSKQFGHTCIRRSATFSKLSFHNQLTQVEMNRLDKVDGYFARMTA